MSPPFTQQEINSLAVAEATASIGTGQITRALVLVTKDEINLLRQWVTDFKAAVAASTSLADLKTRVAALDSMPQRTAQQAKAAMLAKINDSESN